MHTSPLALLALAAPLSAQTTWFVDVNGVPPGTGTALSPYTSIDFAIAQPTTLDGDLVLVLPGTYQETVLLDKGLTLLSTDGPGSTAIDAGGAGSALRLAFTGGAALRVEGFTLRGGTGTLTEETSAGGGIYARGAIGVVAGCIIELNDADLGGGVYMRDSVLELRNCRIRDNLALPSAATPQGGGVFVSGGSATLRRSVISRNVAGDLTTPGEGGGLYVYGLSAVDVASCRINANVAERGGGGVFGSAVIHGTVIARNSGQFGGGIRGAASVTDSVLAENRADSATGTANYGGGVQGGAILTGCTLRDNVAIGSGGGASTATLIDCEVTGNATSPGSTAFAFTSGGVEQSTLIDCELSGNLAVGGFGYNAYGGGAGNSTLIGCDVFDNRTSSRGSGFAPQRGGGLWACTASDCRIFGNDAGDLGGGAYACALDFCEVYGNTAAVGGGAADGTLARCTVYGNSAAQAGGVFAEFGVDVQDSILWNNGVEVGQGSGAATIGWSDVQGGWPGTGNIDADPLFWNAGAGDFHLMAGSPCIDAGNPASPPDPDGSRADMGANPYDPTYAGP